MMNKILNLSTIVSVIVLFILISQTTGLAQAPSTPKELMNKLVQAINDQNREELVSLFNWDGVEEQMKSIPEIVINSLMDGKVKSAELLPLPEDFKKGFLRNGIKYSPNIKLLGIIKISYENRGNEILGDSKIAYGQKNGKYYLPNTITKKTGYEGPADKTININVIGISVPDPVLFDGMCLYTVSGEEMKKIIKGEGNISEAFWGQEVKSCKIRRLSDSGSLKLIISVGSETVFESEMKETPEITYP
ncbi:MAG: hypothetical protein ACR2NW_10335 [Thermodesulfobacteriota bacterium]